MRTFFAGAALAIFWSAAALAGPPPLDVYGKLPTLSDVKLSPDGDKLAYAQQEGDGRAIEVTDLTGKNKTVGISIGDKKLRGLMWAGDGHLLILTSTTGHLHGWFSSLEEWFQIQSLDVATGQQLDLLTRQNTMIVNVAIGAPSVRMIDGQPQLYVRSLYPRTDNFEEALYLLKLDGSEAKVDEAKSQFAYDWLIDENGNAVAETDYDSQTRHWSLNIKGADGFWKEAVGRTTSIDIPNVEGLTPDGTGIVFQDVDQDKYQVISLKDGTNKGDFMGGQTGSLIVDPLTDRVIGISKPSADLDYNFFVPNAADALKTVNASFAGCIDRIVSHSNDWKKVAVHVECPRLGDLYVLVDLAAGRAHPIGREYEGIGPADYLPVKTIHYDAADGRSILAYLTLPKDRDAKNLPLIVMPHGGPAARDFAGFDWWAQAMASRGYAVLQPQYRGSQGFGNELWKAGFGEFGRKMQTDLSDGVKALADQGIADPKRACIVGASYGGYAAMAGITLQTGIYRCAIADAGLSDLPAMMGWIQNHHYRKENEEEQYWSRYMGVDDPYSPKLKDISPIFHIDNVNVPILLTHGTDDTVVQLGQSERMVEALQKAGKTVEFVKMQDEDHWLSRSKTRLQMLEADMKFLEKYNPPD